MSPERLQVFHWQDGNNDQLQKQCSVNFLLQTWHQKYYSVNGVVVWMTEPFVAEDLRFPQAEFPCMSFILFSSIALSQTSPFWHAMVTEVTCEENRQKVKEELMALNTHQWRQTESFIGSFGINAKEPTQSWIVHRVLSLSSTLLSVTSCLGYMCDHKNFIFCIRMHICPLYVHMKYLVNITYLKKWQPRLVMEPL